MKRAVGILLTAIICGTLFASCSSVQKETQERTVSVYSFSGENEQLEISNGVIVLNSGHDVFYGGNLKVNQEFFSDITEFTTTFYFTSGNEKNTLLSNRVVDTTGATIDISGELGRISGELSGGIIAKRENNDWVDTLCFELKTTDLNGEESVYQLPLTVTEITDAPLDN